MSVLSYLTSRSSAAVLSSIESGNVSTSLATLKLRLNSYFGATISSSFPFGSYTRGTILPRNMDEHSDVDYMVVFADHGYTPQTYLDRLRRFVNHWYSSSEVWQSSPTIVLSLNHIKFELVPALSDGWGAYRIPDGPSYWRTTNPNDFNQKLTEKNNSTGYAIKPVIRLAKLWNVSRNWPYDSYLFEKLIVDQYYFYCNSQRDYLFAVFDQLLTPTETNWRRDVVLRAKQLVANVRAYETQAMPASAEAEVKKLILPA